MSDNWRKKRLLELQAERDAAAGTSAAGAAADSSSSAGYQVPSTSQAPPVYQEPSTAQTSTVYDEPDTQDLEVDSPLEEAVEYILPGTYEIPTSELTAGEAIPASVDLTAGTENEEDYCIASDLAKREEAFLRSRHVVVPEAPRYIPVDVDMESRSHTARLSSFAVDESAPSTSTSGQNKRKGKDPTGLRVKRTRVLKSPEPVQPQREIYDQPAERFHMPQEEIVQLRGSRSTPYEHMYGKSDRYCRPQNYLRVYSSNVGTPPSMPVQSRYVERYSVYNPTTEAAVYPQPGPSTSQSTATSRRPRLVTSTATSETGTCLVLVRYLGSNHMEVLPSLSMDTTFIRPENLEPIAPAPTQHYVSAVSNSSQYRTEDVRASSSDMNQNSTYDVQPCNMCRGIGINCCKRRYPSQSSARHVSGRPQTMELERSSMSSDDSYGLTMGDISSDIYQVYSLERAERIAAARQSMATRRGNATSTETYTEPVDFSSTGDFKSPAQDKMNEDQSD